MRRWFRWMFRAGLALFLLLALLVVHTLYFKPLSIRWFYERVFMEYAFESPQLLTSLRIMPAWLNWYGDDLDDASLAQQERMAAKLRDDLAMLRSYGTDGMDADERLSYDVLEYFLAIEQDGQAYRFHDYPLNQMFGIQSEYPTFMASQHAVDSVGDAEDYLARLDRVGVQFAQVTEGLRERERRGILPPTFVVEKVLEEMRGFVDTPPKENILYTSLAEKLDELQELPAEERTRLLGAAEAAIRDRVYPAYAGFIGYYEQLLPRTGGNRGVWALPEGEAYYRYLVRKHTTTEMSPDEIHALGLAEVARIEAEMDAILRAEGLVEGSVGARVRQLAQRPDQLYPDNDEGRAQILADYQKIIDEINAGLDPYFDLRPGVGVEVERIPEFKEQTSPGAYYYPPAMDGSRPGVFYANLRNVAEIPRFGMRTLAYHEAIPGHHFQIAIQQELRGVPTFRTLLPFTAYSEGWALYGERLAWESGFQRQPLDNLGRLQAEMFRAVRLVVDTGLHHKRWTREQAIAYMAEKTGMADTDVVAEIERYLVMPGQALAYKVGMNTILALRERARAELGERFDLRAFHREVLGAGALPMAILQRRIEAWIEREKAG